MKDEVIELKSKMQGQLNLGKDITSLPNTFLEQGYSREAIEQSLIELSKNAKNETNRDKKIGVLLMVVGAVFFLIAVVTWGETIWHSAYSGTTYYYWGGLVFGGMLAVIGYLRYRNN